MKKTLKDNSTIGTIFRENECRRSLQNIQNQMQKPADTFYLEDAIRLKKFGVSLLKIFKKRSFRMHAFKCNNS